MTEQTNIPKPASPLPWTDRGSFGDADIVSASGDSVYREYPYEGGWFQEPDDLSYTLWAANNAQALYEMLSRVCKYLDGGGHIEANSDAHMDIDELLRAARGEA